MTKTNLILFRDKLPNETLGIYLVVQGNKELYRCCVIELPWLNNQKQISCIPDGIYSCRKISTKKHPNSFLIENVPNRTEIMIHVGNFATGKQIDTEGCQCPGLRFIDIDNNGTLDVDGSSIAMQSLNHFLPSRFNIYII